MFDGELIKRLPGGKGLVIRTNAGYENLATNDPDFERRFKDLVLSAAADLVLQGKERAAIELLHGHGFNESDLPSLPAGAYHPIQEEPVKIDPIHNRDSLEAIAVLTSYRQVRTEADNKNWGYVLRNARDLLESEISDKWLTDEQRADLVRMLEPASLNQWYEKAQNAFEANDLETARRIAADLYFTANGKVASKNFTGAQITYLRKILAATTLDDNEAFAIRRLSFKEFALGGLEKFLGDIVDHGYYINSRKTWNNVVGNDPIRRRLSFAEFASKPFIDYGHDMSPVTKKITGVLDNLIDRMLIAYYEVRDAIVDDTEPYNDTKSEEADFRIPGGRGIQRARYASTLLDSPRKWNRALSGAHGIGSYARALKAPSAGTEYPTVESDLVEKEFFAAGERIPYRDQE